MNNLSRIKVTAGHLLLSPTRGTEKTESGIIIPETVRQIDDTGEAVVIGKSLPGEPIEIKKGDIVCFSKNMAEKIKFGENEYVLVRYSDVKYFIPKE